MAHGQPYIGAFLFKDAASDADVITSIDQVHPVGVFAQITSSFESSDKKKGENGEAAQQSLTVVLYPHRRIRLDELITTRPGGESVPVARVVEEVQKGESDEGEVSSFEQEVPGAGEVREALETVTQSDPETERPGRFSSIRSVSADNNRNASISRTSTTSSSNRFPALASPRDLPYQCYQFQARAV